MPKKRKKEILSKEELYRDIKRLFLENPHRSMRLRQVMDELKLAGKLKPLVKEIMELLLVEEYVVNIDPSKYHINMSLVKSQSGEVVTVTQSCTYVKAEGYEEDIVVSAENTQNALAGDIVEIIILPRKRHGRVEGVINRVLQRKKTKFVGVVEKSEHYAFVLVDSRQMPYDIFVPMKDLNGAKNDDKVLVELVDWPSDSKNPIGRILQVFGTVGDNDAEMHAILAEFGLPYHFEDYIEAAANEIPDAIPDEERKRRRDFTKIPTFTIDPADAKDFDDALSVRKVKDGVWEVGVHIADVTYYVKEDSLLDKEAVERGTSVYLVDRTVPMLPEKLSNELCSLRPGEEKLCFSAVFELNENAEVLSEWFGRTVIFSDRRFSYEEAQQVIETGTGDMKEEIATLNMLAQKMKAERYKNGSIAFERDEVKFRLDEKGKPVGVYFKEIKESNQLIEEFMLLANRKVAEWVGKGKNRTFVYRIHDRPNDEKYADFSSFVAKFGYTLKAKSDRAIARELNGLLREIKGKKEENLFSVLALRSMAKARYSTDNIGHYGLAFDFYTHFTSPIRRYPDMMVHRLLAHYLQGKSSADKDFYEELCKHSSEREVVAAEAERASIKYKMVEYMSDKIGQEFEGYISGITEWGIYVELSDTKIEGMVSLRDMLDDQYIFDNENYRLIGLNKKRILTLGDAVKVRVLRADLRRKQLDYELVAHTDLARGKELRFDAGKNGSGKMNAEKKGAGKRRK